MDYLNREGIFGRPKVFKTYALFEDSSPLSSPYVAEKAVEPENVNEEIKSVISNSTTRSGKEEFSLSVKKRDSYQCVFCMSKDHLEGAHYLQVERRDLLESPGGMELFKIGSIMDSTNGITLCWQCHRCFDLNLVCIDPTSGQLLISDALMHNEAEKWTKLVDHIVPACSYSWPTLELMQYRVEEFEAAKKKRCDTRDENLFHCRNCSRGYKRSHYLQLHEGKCFNLSVTPAMYSTPIGKGMADAQDDSA